MRVAFDTSRPNEGGDRALSRLATRSAGGPAPTLRRLALAATAAGALFLFGSAASALAADGRPTIDHVLAVGLTTQDATITAAIEPNGLATTYAISIRCEQRYGSDDCETPAAGHEHHTGAIAATAGVETVEASMSGLSADHFYHYVVEATNRDGTVSEEGVMQDPPPGGFSEGSYVPQPYTAEVSEEALRAMQAWGEGAPAREAQYRAELKAAEEQRKASEEAQRQAQLRKAQEAEALARARECHVPALKGDLLAVARLKLRYHHCRLGAVRHTSARTGTLVVLRQGAPPGRLLQRGARVSVTLGRR